MFKRERIKKIEYLLEFSRIDTKSEIDLSVEELCLINLKDKFNCYKDSDLLLSSLKNRGYEIYVYLDKNFKIIISQEKNSNINARYCFSLFYTLNEKSVLSDFLNNKISISNVLLNIKKDIKNKFWEIEKDLIDFFKTRPTCYWWEVFDEYPFLILIVNIKDFYETLGRQAFFKKGCYFSRNDIEIFDYLYSQLDLKPKNRDIVYFLANKTNMKDEYAKLTYETYLKCIEYDEIIYDEALYLVIYAIYNDLITGKTLFSTFYSPEKIINRLLRMYQNELFNFIMKQKLPDSILEKIFRNIKDGEPIQYNTKIEDLIETTYNNKILYNIEIDEYYFKQNADECLMKITELLLKGIEIKFQHYSSIGGSSYTMHTNEIKYALTENVTILAKILDVSINELLDKISIQII